MANPLRPAFKETPLVYLGIALFTVLFLLPFLGSVHLFESDEANYAEAAREMLVTGDYLNVRIDYVPFPEKPPFFFWLQALSMRLFGVNEFAARFPNVVCGVISLLLLYHLGRKLYGQRFGLLWILCYGSAVLPFFYFKSGMIDPWFNLFIFGGIVWFIFYLDPVLEKDRLRNVALSSFFFGLSVLTKGPVAILVFLLCFLAYLFIVRFRLKFRATHVGLFLAILLVTGGSWFFVQIAAGNIQLLKAFIGYQMRLFSADRSIHNGFFGYHAVVLLLGVFPASVVAMKSFTKKSENTALQRIFRRWMYVLFWVVLLLFSAAKTKLLHYSSLAYFPLTFLAAWVWEKWLDRKLEIGNWQVILILLIALFHASLAILFPLLTDHYDWLLSRDFRFLGPFAKAAVQREVHWSGYEWLLGLFLIIGVAIASVQLLRRSHSGMWILHMTVLIFVASSLYVFTPRVEGYMQRAAIKFYKGMKGKDVYLRPLGFKSYAYLFYSEKEPGEMRESVDSLMNRRLGKDAYFVIRLDKKENYISRYPDLEILNEKDGYVFAVKRAGTVPRARSVPLSPEEP